MNEFERRILEVVKNKVDLDAVLASMGKNAVIEHFGYSAELATVANPLTNGTTHSSIIALQADSYFVLQYITAGIVVPAGSALTTYQAYAPMNVSLQISDTGAGETFYSGPAPGAILVGGPSYSETGIPLILPVVRLIPPNTNIKIEATQLGVDAAGSNPEPIGVYVTLIGSRIGQF